MCHEVRKTNNTAADFPSTRQLATFWVDGVGGGGGVGGEGAVAIRFWPRPVYELQGSR